jgi:cystathionine beta-lyase
VLDSLREIIDFGIIGYATERDELYTAIQSWQKRYFDYDVTREAILFSSGVVPSISLAVQAYTKPGEAVLINEPVYPPFARSIRLNDRKLVSSVLKQVDEQLEIDFADFEEKIVSENVKLFVLCNPHNPGGRVWSKDELNRIGEICKKYDVIVASDEIHEDLVFAPNVHTTFANAGDGFADFSLTFTAATKTFNLAGIKNSMVFIENEALREQFVQTRLANNQHEINTFGLIGTEVAYNTGDQWLAELKVVLTANFDLVQTELIDQTKIEWIRPQGTYLAWLDFAAYGLTDEEIQNRLIHTGKVVLNPGVSFGPGGEQHMRLNVAEPTTIVEDGIKRIKLAFADLEK